MQGFVSFSICKGYGPFLQRSPYVYPLEQSPPPHVSFHTLHDNHLNSVACAAFARNDGLGIIAL